MVQVRILSRIQTKFLMIKQNSVINGEWAKHVRRKIKRQTSKNRRQQNKKILKKMNNIFLTED